MVINNFLRRQFRAIKGVVALATGVNATMEPNHHRQIRPSAGAQTFR